MIVCVSERGRQTGDEHKPWILLFYKYDFFGHTSFLFESQHTEHHLFITHHVIWVPTTSLSGFSHLSPMLWRLGSCLQVFRQNKSLDCNKGHCTLRALLRMHPSCFPQCELTCITGPPFSWACHPLVPLLFIFRPQHPAIFLSVVGVACLVHSSSFSFFFLFKSIMFYVPGRRRRFKTHRDISLYLPETRSNKIPMKLQDKQEMLQKLLLSCKSFLNSANIPVVKNIKTSYHTEDF